MALAREVMEETGLQVNVVAPAYIYDEIQEEKHLIIKNSHVTSRPESWFSARSTKNIIG